MVRLKSAFPKRDPMDLQDILRAHNLNLEAAIQAAAAAASSSPGPAPDKSPSRSPTSKHVKVISLSKKYSLRRYRYGTGYTYLPTYVERKVRQSTYINKRVKAHDAEEDNSESDDDEFRQVA